MWTTHFKKGGTNKSNGMVNKGRVKTTSKVGEWNMKGCKTNTYTHTHTHTYAHIQKMIFYCNLFLLTILDTFKCQMSKESLIILNNVLFHASAKLKYEQFTENYNSSFKMYCGFAA